MTTPQNQVDFYIRSAAGIYQEATGQTTTHLGNGIEIDKIIVEIAKMIQQEKNKLASQV